jgi:AraC-like DNA-binding protein
MRLWRIVFLIAGSLVVLLSAYRFYCISCKPVTKSIFPGEGAFQIKTYTDAEDPLGAGNSEIVSFSADSTIYLSAIIGGKIDYPYAGFRIQPPDSHPFYDIRSFDRIDIVIDSTNATFFILDLTTYVEGYSHFDDYMSFRHHTKELFGRSGPQTLKIPLAAVTTQGWWYNLRKLNPKQLDKPDFSRCHTVSFEIDAVKASKKPLFMRVSSITLVDSRKEWRFAALVLVALWTGVALYVLLSGKKRVVMGAQSIQANPIDLKNHADEEQERLCKRIAELYTDPELSINQVARASGISAERISQILMRAHHVQFKQYLNTVRITEARRLLAETDRQISEIAFAVGYNYPTTFNRIFKEVTGISPTDFRKKNATRDATAPER